MNASGAASGTASGSADVPDFSHFAYYDAATVGIDSAGCPRDNRSADRAPERVVLRFGDERPSLPRRPRRLPKVKWKLFLYLTGFAAVLLIALWLCQVVFLKDIYRTVKTAGIKSAAAELCRSVDDPEALSSRAETVARRKEVCILAYRMLGEGRAFQLLSCDVVKDCAIHNIAGEGVFTLYRAASENGGESLRYYRYDSESRRYLSIKAGEGNGSPESIIYSVVVPDSEGSDVLFLFNSVVTPVDATVSTLNMILVAVSILTVLLALLLAFLFSRRISKPLTDITASALKLASGQYDTEFRSGSYRETGQLAAALNIAAKELSKVDRLRRELIANTSHDLRTPLTLIAGYAEIMRDLPGENTPENAQVILDEANRLSSLVNDMLDISKLESGVEKANPERFCLTTALREGMSRYSRLCRRDGYTLLFYAEREITVVTDRSKLLQAFYNLVNNALTYTGPDKTVIVRQTTEPSAPLPGEAFTVRISVTDSGQGIPEEQLSLIWDRYYRVDAEHKRAAQGTGLGLSIVNKISALLGGRCGVASQMGVGSTFWIEIPGEPGMRGMR